MVEEEASVGGEEVVAVEEGEEADTLPGARTGAAVEAGVVAEVVSTGEHSKYLSSRNPLIMCVCKCECVYVCGFWESESLRSVD